MKSSILISFLLILFTSSFSQIKPTYEIDVHRNGSSIGVIKMELFPDFAPNHVNYFDSLVNIDFFDSLAFHRVIEGFVIQGGDPNTLNLPDSTWGEGQPDQPTVDAEFNSVSYVRGILGAARSDDPNSASSQFFICHDDATFLTGNYTAYGRVIEGMNIVDSVATYPTDANDRPIDKTIMFITRTDDITSSIQPTVLVTDDSLTNVNYFTNLQWETNPEAIYYEIEISQNEDFSIIEQVKTDSDNSVLFTNLETGGIRYYWRVKAYDGASSSISETRTFLTKFLASIEAIDKNLMYYDQNTENLHYESSIIGFKINIFNIEGKLIKTVQDHQSHLNLSFLPKGIYVIEVVNVMNTRTLKIVK